MVSGVRQPSRKKPFWRNNGTSVTVFHYRNRNWKSVLGLALDAFSSNVRQCRELEKWEGWGGGRWATGGGCTVVGRSRMLGNVLSDLLAFVGRRKGAMVALGSEGLAGKGLGSRRLFAEAQLLELI